MQLNRLSSTLISLGFRCQMQLWHYLTIGPKPPPYTVVFGSAFHSAVELDLKRRSEKGEVDIEEVQEEFVDSFHSSLLEAERREDEKDEPELIDIGTKTVKKYDEEFCRKVQAVEIEKEFIVPLDFIDLSCRIDLIAHRLGVVDHKTAWRRWQAGREEKEVQSFTYLLPFYLETKRIVPFRFQVVYPNAVEKGKEVSEARIVRRQPQQLESFIRAVRNLVFAIRNEVPVPNVNGWHCSEKFCGWFEDCPFGRGKVSFLI